MLDDIRGVDWLPYCGAPPFPNEIWTRWTVDPLLWLALLGLGILAAQFHDRERRQAGQWATLVLAAAFVSPLCAASMSLFSARIAQHLLLALIAAPLLAKAFIRPPGALLWPSLALFTALFWYWHFPAPYAQSLRTDAMYWLMHLSVLLSTVLFWGTVRSAAKEGRAATAALALMGAGMQMTFLAAALMFSHAPWHAWHVWAAPRLGLTGITDQQLAAVFMWTAGTVFLIVWLATTALRMSQRYQRADNRAADRDLSIQ